MESKPTGHPHTTRSRIVLETASELVADPSWPYRQARITLKTQGADDWPVTLFGSDGPSTVEEVARGAVQIAIINPSMVLSMAARGSKPFRRPLPLRTIGVIPSFDQIVFAVRSDSGLTCLHDILTRRFPLRVSLRAQRDHSVHLVLNEVLSAAGFCFEDICSWGGEVRYDRGMPTDAGRLGQLGRGEIDAIFDEAASFWGNDALDLNMRFLSVDENLLRQLQQLGMKRGLLERARFPKLTEDIPTVDFSGWAIYTHAETPDWIVTSFCRGLEKRKNLIPLEGAPPLPVDRMVQDTPEAPLGVPLHPAAEQFWRERGYIS